MSATYPVTAGDNQQRFCPACAAVRLIYVEVDETDAKTCCATCQRIIERHERASWWKSRGPSSVQPSDAVLRAAFIEPHKDHGEQ